jgi:sarcosine oxidase subunit gamma
VSEASTAARDTTRNRLSLSDAQIASAWNVQCARRDAIEQAERVFAISLPQAPNTLASTEALTALWLGPASWLLVSRVALSEFTAKRDALNAAGGALFDVSASRVGWNIAGENAATLLAKSCPLDFHVRVFPIGACAQSVYGHVNALFYRNGDTAFTLFVARSFARDVWQQLCASAAHYGYDVVPPAPFSPSS